MSTLMGYMLGRASVQIQQQHERVAQNVADAFTGAVDPETEVQMLRAEVARVREIALRNKEVAEGNHASALSWRERALKEEASKEYWIGRANAAEGQLEDLQWFEDFRAEMAGTIRADPPQDSPC